VFEKEHHLVVTEGKIFGGTSTAFTSGKCRPRIYTKSEVNNSNEVAVPRTVYDFTTTEQEGSTLKTIHSKVCESTNF
jgi:hypothetical protein